MRAVCLLLILFVTNPVVYSGELAASYFETRSEIAKEAMTRYWEMVGGGAVDPSNEEACMKHMDLLFLGGRIDLLNDLANRVLGSKAIVKIGFDQNDRSFHSWNTFRLLRKHDEAARLMMQTLAVVGDATIIGDAIVNSLKVRLCFSFAALGQREQFTLIAKELEINRLSASDKSLFILAVLSQGNAMGVAYNKKGLFEVSGHSVLAFNEISEGATGSILLGLKQYEISSYFLQRAFAKLSPRYDLAMCIDVLFQLTDCELSLKRWGMARVYLEYINLILTEYGGGDAAFSKIRQRYTELAQNVGVVVR